MDKKNHISVNILAVVCIVVVHFLNYLAKMNALSTKDRSHRPPEILFCRSGAGKFGNQRHVSEIGFLSSSKPILENMDLIVYRTD